MNVFFILYTTYNISVQSTLENEKENTEMDKKFRDYKRKLNSVTVAV